MRLSNEPITKETDNPKDQSKLDLITRTGTWRKARENESERVTIGFGFTSDWMKMWRELLSQSCSVDREPIIFENRSEVQTWNAKITSCHY